MSPEPSEKRIQSQQSAALAADARAMSFSATSLAAAAILGGLSENALSPTAMLIGSGLLVAAATVAGYSARPKPFYFPGAKASDLSDDIVNDVSLTDVLAELGTHNDTNSKINDETLRSNSSFMRLAFFVAILGLIVSIAPQLANTKQNTADNSKIAELTE